MEIAMTKHPVSENGNLDNQAVQFDERLESIRRRISSSALPKPEPLRTPGALAQPTPEWVFDTITGRSPDDALFERINGLTLNGPHIPPREPDRSHDEFLRAIVELREVMARLEGERQARLQSTRAAIKAREANAEDRRRAVQLLCKENGWRPDARGIAGRTKGRLGKDPRFRDGDNKPRFGVSRRTIAEDLINLAPTSLSPTE
jgi:hypothetical protein